MVGKAEKPRNCRNNANNSRAKKNFDWREKLEKSSANAKRPLDTFIHPHSLHMLPNHHQRECSKGDLSEAADPMRRGTAKAHRRRKKTVDRVHGVGTTGGRKVILPLDCNLWACWVITMSTKFAGANEDSLCQRDPFARAYRARKSRMHTIRPFCVCAVIALCVCVSTFRFWHLINSGYSIEIATSRRAGATEDCDLFASATTTMRPRTVIEFHSFAIRLIRWGGKLIFALCATTAFADPSSFAPHLFGPAQSDELHFCRSHSIARGASCMCCHPPAPQLRCCKCKRKLSIYAL